MVHRTANRGLLGQILDRIKRFWSKNFFFVLCLVVIGVSSLALGPIMRESDQASILCGALDIAWGGDIVGNSAYRYDKFYGTYWILAGVFWLTGIAVGVDADYLVGLANGLSFGFYTCSILFLSWCVRLRGLSALLALVILASPVLLFSSAFLSPNICSIAFLILMLPIFMRRDSYAAAIGLFGLSFFALACRQDACLAMPALCFLASRKKCFGVLREYRFWAVFLGSSSAFVLSIILADGHFTGVGESLFFIPKIAAAYLVFGLAGTGILLLVFCYASLLRYGMYGWVIALAVLLPVIFYIGLLFSPRHLALAALMALATVILPRGRIIWRFIRSKRSIRGCTYGAITWTVLSLFIGLQMPSFAKIRSVIVSSASRYPTADGYWPMGGSLKFLIQLGRGDLIPIDHNQGVWKAWTEYSFTDEDYILLDSLYRYPQLAAKIQGVQLEFTEEIDLAGAFSERALRRKGGFPGRESIRQTLLKGERGIQMKEGACGILLLGDQADDERAGLARYAAQLSAGNDFLLVPSSAANFQQLIEPLQNHQAFLICKVGEEKHKAQLSADRRKLHWQNEKIDLTRKLSEEGWVLVFRLPDFMHVK